MNHNNVKVVWSLPEYPHGVITGYRVAWRYNSSSGGYLGDDSRLLESVRYKLIGSLTAGVFYRVFVWAKTAKGWGTQAEQVVYTTGSKGTS